MTMPFHLAVWCDDRERPVWQAAVTLLHQCFEQAELVALTFVESLAELPRADATCFAISLLPFVLDMRDAWPDAREKLRAVCAAAHDRAGSDVFLTTVFRCLRPDIAAPEHLAALRMRLHRLNLLAVELSQTLDVSIFDLDRVLSDVGGERLAADARLDSPAAVAMSAETIAWTLLNCSMDGPAAGGAVAAESVAAARDRFATLRSAPLPFPTAASHLRVGRPRDRRPAQTAIATTELLDDRSFRELLIDVSRGRVRVAVAAPQLMGKVAARFRRITG
ncbi:MAG: hypothetical protein WDN25_03365 [Acetobacteraceae bacterium]